MTAVLPEGLRAYLEKQLPAETVEALWDGYAEAPRTSIRLNPFKPYTLPFEAELVSWCGQGRVLKERPVFTLDPAWHTGAYYVQEAGSMSVVEALASLLPEGAKLVLDLCAAPGGKSTHMRAVLPEDCLLVTNEIIRSRVARLQENLERWGHAGHAVTSLDPEYIGSHAEGLFDAIVVDAPCSGEGLFRKDAAAAAEWSEEHVRFCAARQQRILADVWPALKPGGLLLYSTCTLNTDEDEAAVHFLQENFGAELLALPDLVGRFGLPSARYPECRRFLPDASGTEGQFLAALRKPGNLEEEIPELSRKDLQRLVSPKAAELETLRTYLPQAESTDVFVHKDELRYIGAGQRENALRLLRAVPIVGLGIPVLELSGKLATPHQGLATLVGPAFSVADAPLTQAEALAYLRRDDQRGELDLAPGLYRATWQGLGLGWLKAIQGGRINNLLPTQRRIRMDLPNLAESNTDHAE